MTIDQIIGILLIILVIAFFALWLRFQRRQEKADFKDNAQEITVLVKGAYDPNVITVRAGVPLRIHFNRQEDTDCSRYVTFDGLNIRKDLKAFAMTDVEFTPKNPGEISFTCDMGMYQGKIIVT
ncbi:MAG: cupredoxin domain-containing protein [Candidatus Kerfeldbacteria bacterium]|nr:cupredoxin domain-containing protein [Candidatus Kerfeldbacteria bacterium]